MEVGDRYEITSIRKEGNDDQLEIKQIVLIPEEGGNILVCHEVPDRKLVYFIGPESKVYHLSKYCPALCETYWPLNYGELLPNGSIEQLSGFGGVRVGRRPCKRCYSEPDGSSS